MSKPSSIATTRTALADFDLLSQLPAVREKRDRALLRWVDGPDGTPALTTIFESWLTPCDRIGMLFGSRELFLEKVCEIAQTALSSACDVLLSQSCVASIRRTVQRLNEKIDRYNVARRTLNAAASLVPQLIIPDGAFRVEEQTGGVSSPRCGISNTGNKCYFISTLIALCASEQLKRMLPAVCHPSDTTILLQLALRQLESTDSSRLSLCQEPLYGLVESLGKTFDPLRGGGSLWSYGGQQDAQEALAHLLEAALQTTALVHFREIVTRRFPLPLPARQAAASTVGAPHHEDEALLALLNTLFIPSIDGRAIARIGAPISTSNILPVNIPKLSTRAFPLEMVFSGVPGVENIEVEAILGCAENADRLSPELAQRLQEAAVGGMLESMPVMRREVLCGDPPPVLPLHIIRFKTAPVRTPAGTVVSYLREKIRTYIQVPYHLAVPVLGQPECPYELRAVVVHLGESIGSGHYVTCMPDLSSPRDQSGMPMRWKYFNDGHAVETPTWESLAEIVGKNGYLFLYDRVASSIP